MAITIQSTPATYSSVQGDLIYTVAEVAKTADPVTYPNYKFVADVYIGSNLVARIKKVPNPVTRIGIFNIAQIIRSYLSTTFNPAASSLLSQTIGAGEFNISVTVKFGEEYSYTLYTNLTVDSARVFFNNYNGRAVGSSISSFLDNIATRRPVSSSVNKAANFTLLSFFAASTASGNLSFQFYSGSGTLLGSGTRSISMTANSMYVFNVSPVELAAEFAISLAGAQYYTISIGGSAVYRFNLICEPIYQIYTIHFLNKYGGFDSHDFTKVSRKTIDIDRKDFGRLPYTVDVSGVVSYKNANGVYNESRSVYASQYVEKLALNSDLLTDEEYLWLEQLIVSPMVYIEENGSFFPCVITDTNYEPKKNINDELSNLLINIEFGNQLNAQFR